MTTTRLLPFALLLLLRARPAAAQQTARTAPPPQGGTSSEVSIGVAQFLLGTLGTLATEVVVAFAAGEADSVPLAFVGIGVTPAVGGRIVCGLGQSSQEYKGGCAPPILGGYLGALLLGIPMWYVGAAAFSPAISDGGYDRGVGAVLGAALGVVVGTAVGATIGWQASKERRDALLDDLTLAPPPPPPARAAAWSELQPRSVTARAPVAVGVVPLLSLRF